MYNKKNAVETINEMRKALTEDKFSTYSVFLLAGNDNKEKRQEIMKIITGEKRPKTVCGVTKLEGELLSYFKRSKEHLEFRKNAISGSDCPNILK